MRREFWCGASNRRWGALNRREPERAVAIRRQASADPLRNPGDRGWLRAPKFYWEYTLDGGKTFVSMPSTPTGKTMLLGMALLTTVGVRVSLTNSEGPGAWSQVATILVH